ncbi:MAG TPA: hypothetical protein DDY78_26940 [Planctomycetales bacterium]|jgi:hypothetical protein|nr:hypothetical protein [Planctomycetales bacterium]
MCRTWKSLAVTTAALLCLMGCHKTEYLQPPKPKDEFKQPPADDSRYLNPPTYPALPDSQRKGADEPDAPGRGPGARPGGLH